MSRACALLFIFAALAQATGGIRGKVVDDFGYPVSGASITAKSASGKEFKTTSGPEGEYSLGVLPTGSYEVTIDLDPMKPFSAHGVAVDSQYVHLDATLKYGDTLGTLGDGDRFSAAFYRSLPKPRVPEGPAPRLADGTPDLSGYWVGGETTPGILSVEVRPWANAIRNERQANSQRDNPYGFCLPGSVIMSAGSGKFIQTKDYLIILNAGEPARQIFMDGRKHPENLNPTWQGHSIAHWEGGHGEGDTLVVDTVGFNGLAWYGGGFPSTESLHVTERYRRPDLGHLEVQITIDDPPALERPWTGKRTPTLDPTRDVEEYICENNKDAGHMVGK